MDKGKETALNKIYDIFLIMVQWLIAVRLTCLWGFQFQFSFDGCLKEDKQTPS